MHWFCERKSTLTSEVITTNYVPYTSTMLTLIAQF